MSCLRKKLQVLLPLLVVQMQHMEVLLSGLKIKLVRFMKLIRI